MFLRSALVLIVLFASPSLAGAGAPGTNDLLCQSVAQVAFVVDANANGVRDAGEDTACATPVVDDSDPSNIVIRNGIDGPLCVQAVVAQLRGTLTLTADDLAEDNDLDGTQNSGGVLTLVLEIRHGGQVFVLADAYTAASLGSLNLGNWNQRLVDETDIFGVEFTGALFLTPESQSGATVNEGAFDALGARLVALAEQLGLVADANAVAPIVAKATRDVARKRFDVSDPAACSGGCGQHETQEDGALASVAVYRTTISFAEKPTGTPPDCS